jgi:hypothetical protein
MGAIVAAALAASAIASVSAPGTANAAVADASCIGPPTNIVGGGNVNGARAAETFSPVNGGFLSDVRLFVEEEAHVNDTLTLQITPVNSSDLSPVFPVAPLATATVPDSALTPNGSTYPYVSQVDFHFANPPAVNASSEYALVLTRSGASVLGVGIVGPPDQCPDGQLYFSTATSSPWGAPFANDDMVFTTFVGGPPTAPPPAAATGKRAAALAKCKKKHSHKAKKKCKKKASQLPV